MEKMGAEGGGRWQAQQVYRSVSVPQALLRIAQEEEERAEASSGIPHGRPNGRPNGPSQDDMMGPSNSSASSRSTSARESSQQRAITGESSGKRLSLKVPLLGSFRTRKTHTREPSIEEEAYLDVADAGSPEDSTLSSCDSTAVTTTTATASTTRSTSLHAIHSHSHVKGASECSCCEHRRERASLVGAHRHHHHVLLPLPEWPATLDDASSTASSVFYDCAETPENADATASACHRALSMPEILGTILKMVDKANVVPHEVSQQRRKPMSLRHALLIYGDTQSAKAAWREAQREDKRWTWTAGSSPRSGGLYSCMRVSRLWYQVASDVLYDKVHFKSHTSWDAFCSSSLATRSGGPSLRSSVMVLHKIKGATQDQLERVGPQVGGALEWLEFYTCPALVPTRELVTGGRLSKLVLAGCSRVDDRALSVIAHNCPRLQHLDLRACDLVSDHGLKKIARYCPDLRLLNVGRTERGERVTYKAIKHLARRTNVQTLGLAGCHIDDRAMWELALHRGPSIQRLSLNDCRQLTNFSIPRVVSYMPNLSVLELRGCERITDMRPIVQFKRFRELQGHVPLIEGCEIIELRMKEAEWLLEVEASRRIITDCLEWIYSPDSDVDNSQFITTR